LLLVVGSARGDRDRLDATVFEGIVDGVADRTVDVLGVDTRESVSFAAQFDSAGGSGRRPPRARGRPVGSGVDVGVVVDAAGQQQ
jgi:hypothetical protein